MEAGARRLLRSLLAAGFKDLAALKARSLVEDANPCSCQLCIALDAKAGSMFSS